MEHEIYKCLMKLHVKVGILIQYLWIAETVGGSYGENPPPAKQMLYQ